jgi:plastocyanin
MYDNAASLRQTGARLRAMLATALVLGLLLSISFAGTAQAATTLNVGVGVGSGTVSGNAYLPGDVTILVGDSVKWTIESDEPHSVTFGSGPAGTPPDEWPGTGLTGTVPPPPGTANLTGTYAGTGFLNTGLLFKGSTATVQFSAAGSLPYICVIHPGMAGVVNVVASGTPTTQAEADTKAQQTRDALNGAVAGVQAAAEAAVTETERPNGTSLWSIFTSAIGPVGPQPGGGTGYLELLRFIPQSLEIEEGDTVKWTSPSVHTVTFLAEGAPPTSVDPFTTPPTGDNTYDGETLHHSGLLGIPAPGAPNTYELTFPDPGTFPYICALHIFLGQTGQIQVAAAPEAPVITPPATDVGALSAAPPSESPPWLAIGLLAAFAVVLAAGTLALRRR